jgi:hypothetical protein
MVFWDYSKIYMGFLGILWYLGKLTMYSTWSVTNFFAIKGMSDPNGPPFFFKGCGLGSKMYKKKSDEGRFFLLFVN